MKPGRKSSAGLAAWPVYVRPLDRLQPPADLSAEGRQLFLDLVLANEPTHFRASDLPLLSAYVRAVLQEQAASAHYEAEGHVTADNKPSAWLAVLGQSQKALVALSHRLRLSPQSRTPTKFRKGRRRSRIFTGCDWSSTPMVSRTDRRAMKRAIAQMRGESAASREHVDRVLREEGFESAA